MKSSNEWPGKAFGELNTWKFMEGFVPGESMGAQNSFPYILP
jgi:hypothetical protein